MEDVMHSSILVVIALPLLALVFAMRTRRFQKLPGADPHAARFVLEPPQAFDATGFEIQQQLEPMRFEPLRFMRGRVKSLLDNIG